MEECLFAGKGEDPGQAQAIRYLVASAVAGMEPAAVAVIDAATGVVLVPPPPHPETTSAAAETRPIVERIRITARS